MWTCVTFDTMTGELGAELDVPALSWTLTVADCTLAVTRDKGAGEGDATGVRVPWSAVPGADAAARDRALAPLRRGLCLMRDGLPVVAGAVGSRTDTWGDTAFSLVSPLGLLRGRIACVEGTFGRGAGSTTQSYHRWSGQSLRSVVAWLVHAATTKPGGGLPIDVDHYRGEKGGHERTYDGFNAANNDTAKLIEAITNVDGGPDVQFRPYLSDPTHLRWRLVAGSDSDPRIHADGLVPTLTCFPGGGTLQGVTVAHLAPAMRVYGTGSGQDRATLCHLSEDLSLCQRPDPWPLVEAAVSDSSDWDSAALVKRHADARLAASRLPLVQLQGTVDASDGACAVRPGLFWPGQACYVDLDGFPSLPDGRYPLRVMDMSGDLGDSVKVTFDQIVDPWEGGAYAPQ